MMSATYYVSPSGNDSNRGTSASAPWKSLAKVSDSTFNAGDEVLFQGGATFDGTLHMYKGGGTSADPVVYGSYGSGRATISAGTADAVMTYNVGGFKIENLVIVGKSSGNNSQEGLRIEANEKNTDLPAITVTGCDISGFYGAGLCLLGDVTGAGWTSESITYDTVHNNVVNGIETSGADPDKLTGVYIAYDTVYDNTGARNVTASGSGITGGNLEGALIEHDVAYGNGSTGTGGVGIWAYDSDKVTIQYCASYDNVTTGVDGDGFDFDADTSNSVMQYNYAANNDGGGFLDDQWKTDSDQVNNVIRFNIAQNNGHKGTYGDLEVWGKAINAEFYNNTVYDSLSSAAIRVHNSTISGLHADGVHFANNIIVTTAGAAAVNIPTSMLTGSTGLTFTGNVYYATNGKPTMIMGSKTYTSLAAFQAAGYEKVGSTDVGSSANPELVAAGSGGTSITTSTNLASYLSGYQLQKTSTVATTAVNLNTVLGVTSTGNDMYGDGISADTVAAGVDTVASTTAATPTSNPTPTTTPTPTPTPTPTTKSPTPTPTKTPTPTPTTTKGTVGSSKLTGWDIGSPGKAGSNSVANGTYSMTAGGTDIWGTSDSFRYDYTTLTGNGQIIAQVASEGEANSWSKAGVMIRNGTTAANAAEVAMLVTPAGVAQTTTRKTAGAATTATDVNSKDEWVKLVRNGSQFDSYISANGTTWTEVAQQTVAMGSTVSIGLAVTSHDNAKSESATFKNVSITGT